ncbi:MAG TPA: carbamoyltransferase [Candidatus Hydrogenedentes bacterium]|nr:carbamoyltransferase [Candidatus Hydrogenedentota bacterium]
MNILGIGGYSHDAAVALVCDGELVAAVAEERLSRIKHQGGVPRRAVAWCLEHAGLTPDDIDHIGAYMRPFMRVARRLPYRVVHIPKSPLYSAGFIGYELLHNAQYVWGMRSLRGAHTRLHYMEHHPAHAASAFLVSPFDKAALLTIDYIGEWSTTWAGLGAGTCIERRRCTNYPNSLGVFYSAITDYLGFLRASDEYKVMGLAAYGEPEFYDDFRRIIRPRTDGWYDVDRSWLVCHYLPGSIKGYFSRKFLERFGPPRRKGEPIEKRHSNIAASAQRVLEDRVLGIAEWLHRETGSSQLCLAGGVALNCAMNGRLQRESPFDELFIQPAAGDDGIAIGAAFQLHHQLTGAPRSFVMRDARLGPGYDNAAIRACLDAAKVRYTVHEDVAEATAGLLGDGKIVGWFEGRTEFGPRALGARSILADPTRHEMKDLLNSYVKHREDFRPFAPMCLEERAHEYFTGCSKSPFMLVVYPVEPSQRERLDAITHCDGTARVQTVSKETNPLLHRLLTAFERHRGVPVILNTSFNVMGEPIVCSPVDALRCFYSTGIDTLVMGDCIVEK